MHLRELQDLISDGESEHVEFKRSTGQRTEAAKTVCAMLNRLGGFVLFGVNNQGELSARGLSQNSGRHCGGTTGESNRPAFPEIETVNRGRACDSPVNRCWWRRSLCLRWPSLSPARTDYHVMPRDEYERRLVARHHATRRWENNQCQRPYPLPIWMKKRFDHPK